MTNLRTWLKGKKTYLVAFLLLVATLALVAIGRLTPSTALTLLLIAASLFPATFHAALQHHHEEEMNLLLQIALTGAAVLGKNVPAALQHGGSAALQGAYLAAELKQECASPAQHAGDEASRT